MINSLQVGGLYRLQHQGGDWLLQHRTRSTETQNDTEVKEVRRDTTTWYVMHKFQTVSRQLEDFQSCCTKYERENPRLSKVPTCITKSEGGTMAKVLSGTTFKTIKFEDNIDVEKPLHDLSDIDLNNVLITEFEIVLNVPLKFNSIMKELQNK